MGRSHAVAHSAARDTSQRQSKTKTRRISDILENTETETFRIDDVKKSFYHCNYCLKDISGKIRIKCAICSDFDLCVECFSVGAELHPHKNNHPYRVMDSLAFPLFCAEWNADEELLLLEGLEIYGLSNWSKVAEHVGTKSKSQCIDHYNMMYMNSPCFPLPDMSHVLGKSKEELLVVVRELSEINKAPSTSGEVDVKEGRQFSASIKSENQREEAAVGLSSSSTTPAEVGHVGDSSSRNMPTEADFQGQIADQKQIMSGGKGVSMKELSGYNSKRQDFDTEYDNDAEKLLADMEFKDSDTDVEHFLKRQMLHVYRRRLDERKRRKDFVLDRNLLSPDLSEKDLTLEERELCNNLKVFTRFHSKEKHDELLRSVIEEHRILKRIQELQNAMLTNDFMRGRYIINPLPPQELLIVPSIPVSMLASKLLLKVLPLQEARAAGCVTSSEAERYIEQKRKKAMEENSCQGGPSGSLFVRPNQRDGEKYTIPPGGGIKSPTISDSGEKSSSSITEGLIGLGVSENWDITGFPGADELSEDEKQLCGEIRILPTHYLSMVQTMKMEISNGNVTKSSDAHTLFKVDPGKIDKVFDMLIRKWIVPKHD